MYKLTNKIIHLSPCYLTLFIIYSI